MAAAGRARQRSAAAGCRWSGTQIINGMWYGGTKGQPRRERGEAQRPQTTTNLAALALKNAGAQSQGIIAATAEAQGWLGGLAHRGAAHTHKHTHNAHSTTRRPARTGRRHLAGGGVHR